MKFSSLLLISTLLIACQTKKKKTPNRKSDLSTKIDSIIQLYQFNGVLLVSNDSRIIYSKAVGFSDLENNTQIKLKDQFIIGSISKQITAVLILKAYEKGRIKLTDTIDKYLPKIEQAWKKEVTIHQLLTHTHGIVALNKSLAFKQGAQFRYSQLGYALLAQILEHVSEKSFKELSTELFEQYDLKNTFHPKNKVYKNLVKGYEESQQGILEFNRNSLENYAAAGSFISNAQDLSKWNQFLHTEKLVRKETLDLMKTNYATRVHPIFSRVEYGYGLLFKPGEQNIQIGALGYAPGFVSACYYYPQSKLNLVILENIATNLADFNQTFIVHTKIMELIKDARL